MQALKASRPATGQGEPTSEFASAGGPRGSNAIHRTSEAQDGLRRLEIFQLRCDACALLAAYRLMTLRDAVDRLWASAEADGLVRDIGTDAVQAMMATAFEPWSEYFRS